MLVPKEIINVFNESTKKSEKEIIISKCKNDVTDWVKKAGAMGHNIAPLLKTVEKALNDMYTRGEIDATGPGKSNSGW